MPEPITKGDRYELRIARLLFWEDAFVRRAINLNAHFGEELTVTDIGAHRNAHGRTCTVPLDQAPRDGGAHDRRCA